ncbi:actin, gamma-enteric smooth muscle [Elysia marginata]|uniref:Actin, gamma-enteric smooth muscle n=1 Tax=Elysia marginata TaxID=1093978 RepID=A0AAV4FAP4_9GAST|nr:actin, gamma-enteric smooth muscle [Elysia marginata]
MLVCGHLECYILATCHICNHVQPPVNQSYESSPQFIQSEMSALAYFEEKEDWGRGLHFKGGKDIHKNLILTVPTDKLSQIEGWSVQDLTWLFMCQASISKYLHSEIGAKASPVEPRLVCVSDLRLASSACMAKLVDALEAVEYQQRGTVVSVYFLKPRNKARSHLLKKMLGVKPSKKNPKIPLFKVVLLKTLQELHAHVDLGQLTLDFSGTLQYNHQAYMQLYKVVIQCIRSGQRLLSQLPSFRDRVELLQEYDTDGHTSSQLQQLLADLTEKFQMIHSESSLPMKLQETKQTLFSLEHPGVDDQLATALPKLTEGLCVSLRSVYTQLEQHNSELEEAWRATESKLTLLMQVQKHRERAREIEHKICQHYQPLLQEHPIVGRTLSQAELYRAHFTTTLHEPAKELLSQATEILEAVQRLKSSESLQSVTTALGRRRNSVAPAELVTLDMSDITRCLTTSIQPFAGQLQKLQQIYVNVHIFHLLFEKALSWYKKVLKFIPETLLERCAANSGLQTSELVAYSESQHGGEMLLFMPTDWAGAVRAFLSRHPPPRQEHIERLDESIPHLVDKRLKAQARSLALRLRLLQRVMSSSRLPLRLLQAVVAWKFELFGAHPFQDRPSSSNLGATTSGSPGRDRQRGVQFSAGTANMGGHPQHTPGEEEVREQPGFRYGTHRPPSGEGIGAGDGLGAYTKFGRPRKFPSGMDSREAVLGGSRNPHPNAAEGIPGSSLYGTEAVSGPDQARVMHDRGHPVQHKRTAGARSMLRSKSVDFNFNSSSTDGSVFDYDKAVLGLKEGRGFGEENTVGLRPHTLGRKQHQRDFTDSVQPSHHSRHGIYAGDEQVMSDPSHLVAAAPGSRLSFALSDNREEFVQGNAASSAYGSVLQRRQQARPLSVERSKLNPTTFTGQPERARSAHFPLSSDSSGQERFIRISLSPRKSSDNSRDEFQFPSECDHFGRAVLQGGGVGPEEEESGFDTAEGDPYDSIVTRIREISSSNYTSAEKLQKVSDLISKSQKGDRSQRNFESGLMKSAKSTIDLTRRDNLRRINEKGQTGNIEDPPNHPAQSSPVERPVDVIYRMKQNIAKSMEDLSSAPVPPQQESNAASTRFMNERFRSELRMEPVYTLPRGRRGGGGEIRVVRSGEYNKHSMSDVETSKSSPMLTSPGDGGSRTRTGSEIELSFDNPLMEDGWSNMADGDGEGSLSSNRAPRPSNLAIPSSRNFISPSFLRPAMSMQDLSSRPPPLTAANLGLLQELGGKSDFDTLKDMEMLTALQAEPYVQLQQRAPGNASSGSSGHSRKRSVDLSRLRQPSDSSRENKDAAPSEHKGDVETRAANKDVIANFVLLGNAPSLAIQADARVVPRYAAASSNTSNTSPSWLAARGFLKQTDSFSTEEDVEASTDVLFFQNKINLNRLSLEAEQEYISQEDVAQSLRNTQRILESEEKRQLKGREFVSGVSFDEGSMERDEREIAGQAASGSASVDNGYSSWASRLVSALSTSSEGGEAGMAAVEVQSEDLEKEGSNSSASEDTYSNCSEET